MSPGESERRQRGRPRAEGAEQKILESALEEYTEHGWAGFTMDGVARRAGYGKSTLYLRWTDKDALLTDAIRLRTRTIVQVDTGSFASDLTALTTDVFRTFATPAGWAGFRMIIDDASSTRPLGNFTSEAGGVRRALMESIFERARERGEVSAGPQPLAVAELIYGAALFFTLANRLDRQPIDEGVLETRVAAVVALILDGLT